MCTRPVLHVVWDTQIDPAGPRQDRHYHNGSGDLLQFAESQFNPSAGSQKVSEKMITYCATMPLPAKGRPTCMFTLSSCHSTQTQLYLKGNDTLQENWAAQGLQCGCAAHSSKKGPAMSILVSNNILMMKDTVGF